MAKYVSEKKLDYSAKAGSAQILLCIFSSIVTVLLLIAAAEMVGRPSGSGNTGKFAVADSYRMAVTNRFSTALEGVVETKKSYWIGADALTAPRPSQTNFGSSNDPEVLRDVVRRASRLLDGQELYFDPDVQLWQDTPVEYYRDETILSLTWKINVNNSVYTITEVKVADPSQFRRFLSGGEFGSGKLYTTSEMAASVNAVVATSADYYNYRPAGITVYKGQLRRNNEGMTDICYIDSKGNLLLERGQNNLTDEQVKAYIAEHDINFSLAFGPIVIKDGEHSVPAKYYFGEINESYARAGIAQLGELHYVVMNANEELGAWWWPTVAEFSETFVAMGAQQAYILDGGQTATTVVNGKVINHVSYGSERKISDIIYFATAIPDGG